MPIYLRLLHRKQTTNLENNPVDVLLLGPQVRYMKSDFEKRLSPKGSQQMSLACLITA